MRMGDDSYSTGKNRNSRQSSSRVRGRSPAYRSAFSADHRPRSPAAAVRRGAAAGLDLEVGPAAMAEQAGAAVIGRQPADALLLVLALAAATAAGGARR